MFEKFDKVTLEEWREKIILDLKSKSHDLLEFNDEIEEFSHRAYYHNSELSLESEKPGNYPYKRGFNKPLNNWSDLACISIDDEKTANRIALNKLMSGATGIWFIQTKETNWRSVLDGIELKHIETQFSILSISDYLELLELINKENLNHVKFNIDPLTVQFDISPIIESLKRGQHSCFVINGFNMQQCGANTWQEISFSLNIGHEILLKLMDQGLNIDQASACIHFHIGVGSNYFYEIAKIRSFKSIWSKVIAAYNPSHACSHKANITAIIGHMNKSLNDPYTNLLRQTTEAMSAVAAGIDQLAILPYDLYAESGVSELAARMALNLSLILKEESTFDGVIDPIGGSYSVEVLSDLIGQKAWTSFKELENNKGLMNPDCLSSFKSMVKTTSLKRVDKFRNGEITGIGINKFHSEDESAAKWRLMDDYIGLTPLIFEQTINTTVHES